MSSRNCRFLKHCTREAWHKPDTDDPQSAAEPVLDLWNKDFLSPQFKKVRPQDASLFACAMRIRHDVFTALTPLSGQGGVFLEPRSPDGRQQNDAFHTVWLPKMDMGEATAAVARACKPASLIRVHRRYGLKVAIDDASVVHAQFHPGVPFMGAGESQMYQLGPLPWGTSRQSLQKLFATFSWAAVPIQPIGKSACNKGLLWIAKATQPPSSSVVSLSHGDIIIVRREMESPKQTVAPSMEASQLTKAKLRDQGCPQESDPWAQAAARLPTMKGVTQGQMDQMEQRLLARIDQQKGSPQDVDMRPAVETRLSQLEQKYDQLAEAQKLQVQETQGIKLQLDNQAANIQNRLDLRMAQQMERIEALLGKKPRHE